MGAGAPRRIAGSTARPALLAGLLHTGCGGCGDRPYGAQQARIAPDTGCERSAWHVDLDHDGYGAPQVAATSCDAPEGLIADGSDCNDVEASTNPTAEAVCADGVDNNCDGAPDCDAADGRMQTQHATATIKTGDHEPIGSDMASADLTGDGRDDLVISAPAGVERLDVGYVYVVAGPAQGAVDPVADGWALIDDPEDNNEGQHLAAGDGDGDGDPDLLLGYYRDGRYGGKVIPGPIADDLDPSDTAYAFISVQMGEDEGGDCSTKVDLGDLIGQDGQGDVLLDSGCANDGAGSVFVVEGPVVEDVNLNNDATTVIFPARDDDVPVIVNAEIIGDTDGDGLRDIALTGDDTLCVMTQAEAGSFVYDDVCTTLIYDPDYRLGYVFADAGDLDGDGLAELVSGNKTFHDVLYDRLGYAYVYLYSGATLTAHAHGMIDGEDDAIAWFDEGDPESGLGMSMATPGDLDGDGRAELFLGDPGHHDGFDDLLGAAYLFYGPLEGSLRARDADAWVYGDEADMRLGWSVATSAGDAQNNALLLVAAWPLWGEGVVYQFSPGGY